MQFFGVALAITASFFAFFAGYRLRSLTERDDRYFHKNNRRANGDKWSSERLRRELSQDRANFYKAAASEVSQTSINDFFRYFTSFPHVGGTKESRQQAEYMAEKLRLFGFDKVELKKYTALLSVPRAPGNVSLFDARGDVLFNSTILEKPLHQSEGDPREIYPFNAYTASGQAEGELVYVNYGTNLDFEQISRLNISLKGKIVIARYGKNFRGDKVNLAEKAGAAGVLLYTDPADYSSNVNYPNSWYLPETAVQRGNILKQKGDPLSPGYPSVDGMFRMKPERIKYLHKIPCQPISFKDARVLFSYLDGQEIPSSKWQGGINLSYRVTAKTKLKVRISVDVALVDRPIYNVIATIFGDVEPDRMLLIGNHRDAWVYGAGDPSSGTAAMMETGRVFGSLLERGWRPRRSVLLCSWDAEEYGLMGSREWVEDYQAILNYRAIAYINIDIAVQGNHTLRVKSSPHLIDSFYDIVKQIEAPDTNVSLFEDWSNKTPSSIKDNEPVIYKLGAGSDFTPFYATVGVPAIDFRYHYDSKTMDLPSYPVYHTIHDNYHWMTSFVDPDFKYHKVITQIWVMYTLHLVDSSVIPFNVTRYSDTLLDYINDFMDDYSRLFTKQGIDIEHLKNTAREFKAAASNFETRLGRADLNNSMVLRAYNDQLMELERCFISPGGLGRRPSFKHVLYSPSSVNIYLGRAIPAVIEAIYRVQQGLEQDWDHVQIQISIVVYHIQMAIKLLDTVGK
eukprot:gene16201-17831_t